MVDTNIYGYQFVLAAVLPHLRAQRSGQILNIASIAAHAVGEANGVYASTKHFISAMTESLRKEVGVNDNIQVAMVSPGTIDTGRAECVPNPDGRAVAEQLNETTITPAHIADAVSYALNRPEEVAISEIVVAPARQGW